MRPEGSSIVLDVFVFFLFRIADHLATDMTFLCMVPPSEDWEKVSKVAFEAWVNGRAALEEAKKQAAERERSSVDELPDAN